MRTLQLKDHLTLSALKEKLATAKDLRIFKQWQIHIKNPINTEVLNFRVFFCVLRIFVFGRVGI